MIDHDDRRVDDDAKRYGDACQRIDVNVQPEQVVDRQETKRILAEAIDKLTEKEQKVIALYYFEELTLKEISNVLEVSESRVSQLHTKALKKMKERLGDQIDLFGIGNI